MVQQQQPLRTKRLLLRRFERGDLDDLAILFADESVNRYLYTEPRSREETLERLEKRLEKPEETAEDNVLNLAVLVQDTPRVVGDFMLHWTENDHRQGEFGGSLLPEVHGLGYASEIYGALLEIGFDTYGLHRIVGRCDGRNQASIRSLEKAGLSKEAHLRENEFVKGEWTDEVIMAIRAEEWRAQRS
jgi:RimJ/RimL family protein N-acetyltransferase